MKIGKYLLKKSFSSLDDRNGKIDIFVYEEDETEKGVKIGQKHYLVKAILDEKHVCIQGEIESVPKDILNNLTRWGF